MNPTIDAEYFEVMNRIQKLIERKRYREASDFLEEMEAYKPIRLSWFVKSARVLFETGTTGDGVRRYLRDKYSLNQEYPGVRELLDFFVYIAEQEQAETERKRAEYMRAQIVGGGNRTSAHDKADVVQMAEEALSVTREYFVDHVDHIETLKELQELYYIMDNRVLYALVSWNLSRLDPGAVSKPDYLCFTNSIFLKEWLQEGDRLFLVMAEGEGDLEECEAAVNLLLLSGRRVCMLCAPIDIEVEVMVSIEDTIAASLEYTQVQEGLALYYPIRLVCGEEKQDNRADLIQFILEQEEDCKLAAVIAKASFLDQLCRHPKLQKSMERLLESTADFQEGYLTFGWAGNYVDYISWLYGMDVQARLDAPAECRVSIVVPARNSARTLRYTLMTCLEQRYTGSYEVVLSDNSDEGNTQVYDLFCELDDSRIRYYRTPRNLNLTKSFEYAFLQARGDFTFSIGSDDGVLPWALEVLVQELNRFPGEPVLHWQRGFYAWPGTGVRENMLVIPSGYEKNNYEVISVQYQIRPDQVIGSTNEIYLTPMLYINSGFRRSLLKQILKETGRLWDGVSQDVYMGIVVAAIRPRIFSLPYPLTLAGASSSSIGMQSNRPIRKSGALQDIYDAKRASESVCACCASSAERLLPDFTTDGTVWYRSMLRAGARGVFGLNPEEIPLSVWGNIWNQMYSQLQPDDLLFDKKVHELRQAAEKWGKAALCWFDQNIYDPARSFGLVQKRTMDYQEENHPGGGKTLDASKYGVTNIYEACKLFETLSGL